MSTLTRVVLTHLHFDHAGSLTLLPESVPIVVQRREWERRNDGDVIKRNFFYPRDYDIDGPHRRDASTETTTCSGTGRSMLLLTPGHTPAISRSGSARSS